MSGGEKTFGQEKGADTFAPGEVGGVIKNYTPEEARQAMAEIAAYEAMPDDETAEQYEETALTDEEIASIASELEDEDDGEASD